MPESLPNSSDQTTIKIDGKELTKKEQDEIIDYINEKNKTEGSTTTESNNKKNDNSKLSESEKEELVKSIEESMESNKLEQREKEKIRDLKRSKMIMKVSIIIGGIVSLFMFGMYIGEKN